MKLELFQRRKMNNLNDLTKAISEAVSSSPSATQDSNTIPIEIDGVDLSLYKVEYDPDSNMIVIFLD